MVLAGQQRLRLRSPTLVQISRTTIDPMIAEGWKADEETEHGKASQYRGKLTCYRNFPRPPSMPGSSLGLMPNFASKF